MKNDIHVAFFCFPHHSNVHPALSVVSTLVRRGYRVTFVTSDLFAAEVSALGAEVIHCPRYIDFSPDGKPNWTGILDMATRTLSAVGPFYENNKPNVILYDRESFAGRIFANRWHIPAVTMSPGLAFERAKIDLLGKACKEHRDWVIAFDREVKRFLAGYRICEGGYAFHYEKLNIYFYPEAYQLDGDAFDDSYFYAGRCAAERPYHGIWKPANGGHKPRILVSMSTAFHQEPAYFKTCVEALSSLQYDVLLAIGDHIDPVCLGSLPPSFEVVQRVPLIRILPHASLLIFQGGPTSTIEAMYHGVPLLMLPPRNPDLESYSENAVRLGIGVYIRKSETTAERIKDSALRILADGVILRRVKQMQAIVRRAPGGEETANRVEEFLAEAAD